MNDRDRRPPPDDVERYEAGPEHPSLFAHLDALDEAGDPFDDVDSDPDPVEHEPGQDEPDDLPW